MTKEKAEQVLYNAGVVKNDLFFGGVELCWIGDDLRGLDGETYTDEFEFSTLDYGWESVEI